MAAAFAFALALVTLLSGGLAWRAIAFSSRDPVRPLIAGVVLLVIARALAGADEFRRLVGRYAGPPEQMPSRVAALASISVLVFALAWSSSAAGGSDSSCYVLQAEAFARGHATLDNGVARVLPDAPNAVFAPSGFLPSRSDYGRSVPICGPGLALVMAGAYLVHPQAVFLIVPVTAALLVWLTFVYGRRLDGGLTGASAAVLLACSPIFLYQAVQPMSDVPAAAAWLASLVCVLRGDRRGLVLGGLCFSVAVLMRANLAVLVVPLAAACLPKRGLSPFTVYEKRGQPPFSAEAAGEKRGQPPFWVGRKGDSPLFSVVLFGAAALPGLAVMLALNAARYGGPFASGYGDTGGLFAWTHVTANLARYPRWMLETQTPFVLLALGAPWWASRDPERRRLVWVSLASVALIVATYLAYTVFDDWWYLRFLLPVLPLVVALSVAVCRALMLGRPFAWLSSSARRFVLVLSCIAPCLWGIDVARARHVTDLRRLEARFALAGARAARVLPADAVVIAGSQTGSLRFHGHRDTIAWDGIAPDELDRTVATLLARGRPVYFALDDEEESRFRRRFAGERLGALDWPPMEELPPPVRVRFYALLRQ